MHLLIVWLAPGSLNHTANIIKGFAIAIGIAIAIAFVWMWWASRLRERRLELSVRAQHAFERHLTRAIQHPELAEPMVGGLTEAVEQIRYRHFVAALLSTADEILALDGSPSWEAALLRQLAPHRSLLASSDMRNGNLRDCSERLRALVDRVTGPAVPNG